MVEVGIWFLGGLGKRGNPSDMREFLSGKSGFLSGLKKTVEWFDNSKNLSHYKSKLYNF